MNIHRILVVEDDPMVSDVTTKILMKLGFAVVSFSSHSAAVVHLDNDYGYSLLLLDVRANGAALLRLLEKARTLYVPVLFVTGGIEAPKGYPVLDKPWTSEALYAAVISSISGASRPSGSSD